MLFQKGPIPTNVSRASQTTLPFEPLNQRRARLSTFLITSLLPTLFTAGATALVYFWAGITFTLSNFVGIVLIVYGVIFLETVLHELGHLAVATMIGFRFHFFAAGPLTFFRRRGKLMVAFKRLVGAVGAGAAGFIPLGTAHLAMRVRLVALGGLAASALLSALGLVLVLLSSGGLFAFFAGMLAVYPLVSLTFNLPPYRMSGTVSDGALVLATAAGRDVIDAYMITASSAAGEHPAEWDSGLLHTLLEETRPPETQALAHLLSYYRALDGQQIWQAGRHLADALLLRDAAPFLLEVQILFEAAYFSAYHQRDGSAGQHFLAAAQESPSLTEESIIQRAEAAVLLTQGQADAADRLLRAAIDSLEKPLDRGLAFAERVWLDELSRG